MRRTLATLTTTAIASAVLLMPAAAHADDPPEPDPCATEALTIAALEAEVIRWTDRHSDAIDRGWVNTSQALTRALLAEDRAAELTAQVAARTAERDRELVRASRQARTIARLQAKVAELRARIRQEPQS